MLTHPSCMLMDPHSPLTRFHHKLVEALQVEETGVSLYNRHLSNTLFFSGFSPKVRQRMREILALLSAESLGHEESLQAIVAELKEMQNDVH